MKGRKKTGKKTRDREGPPDIGPITESAFYGGPPPPIIHEWHEVVQEPGDFILLWAGANRGHRNAETTLSWSWLTVGGGDKLWGDAAKDEKPQLGPYDPSIAAKVERLLSPLAHESRIQLMLSMFKVDRSSTEMAESTGLKGGNLYYHLKELVHAGYVREQEGIHGLTDLGRQLLLTFTSIASQAVKDRGEYGLAVGQTNP